MKLGTTAEKKEGCCSELDEGALAPSWITVSATPVSVCHLTLFEEVEWRRTSATGAPTAGSSTGAGVAGGSAAAAAAAAADTAVAATTTVVVSGTASSNGAACVEPWPTCGCAVMEEVLGWLQAAPR